MYNLYLILKIPDYDVLLVRRIFYQGVVPELRTSGLAGSCRAAVWLSIYGGMVWDVEVGCGEVGYVPG
jgi:hypothetical protein